MKIAIGSDHAGFNLKEKIKKRLSNEGHNVEDCGAFSDERSDYPDLAKEAASRVSDGHAERGVLVCGSGIGMCMAANRYPKVRAVVVRDERDAEISRRHNDANVACIGSRVTPDEYAVKLIVLFLETPFDGGRHSARVAKIELEGES